MIIGVPKEIKDNENRVAAIPATVQALTSCGHTVLVQKGAGAGSGISDQSYESVDVTTLMSSQMSMESCLRRADVVIGAVLIHGAKAPRLVTRQMLKLMQPGTVIGDVAVDQGGCCETTRPTTHSDPIYVVDGIVHYCVANMPGAYARTSNLSTAR
jgi:alanine dehydrogenase